MRSEIDDDDRRGVTGGSDDDDDEDDSGEGHDRLSKRLKQDAAEVWGRWRKILGEQSRHTSSSWRPCTQALY